MAPPPLGQNFFSTSLREDGYDKTVERFNKMTPEQLLRCISSPTGGGIVVRNALANLIASRESMKKAEEFSQEGLPKKAAFWRRKSIYLRKLALQALRVYIASIYKFQPKRKRKHHEATDEQVAKLVLKALEEKDFITGGRLFKFVFGHSKSVTEFDRERSRQLRRVLAALEEDGFLTAKDEQNMGNACLRIYRQTQPIRVSIEDVVKEKLKEMGVELKGIKANDKEWGMVKASWVADDKAISHASWVAADKRLMDVMDAVRLELFAVMDCDVLTSDPMWKDYSQLTSFQWKTDKEGLLTGWRFAISKAGNDGGEPVKISGSLSADDKRTTTLLQNHFARLLGECEIFAVGGNRANPNDPEIDKRINPIAQLSLEDAEEFQLN